MAKVMKSAQTMLDNYVKGRQASGPAYANAMQNLTENPCQLAAQNPNGYISGVQQNVGKWQKNLNNVSFQDYKQAATTKGSQSIATVTDRQKTKAAAGIATNRANWQALKDKVSQIDGSTRAGRRAKANAALDFWDSYASQKASGQ